MTSREAAGSFVLLLHSHLPYARLAGRWPHGEEWLHEALAETYLPLLLALRRLQRDGIRAPVTVGVTPVLAEQLADPTILDHFAEFLAERLERARADVRRLERAGDNARAGIARWYATHLGTLKREFHEVLGGDIIRTLRELQGSDSVEIAGSAATHGYLPLFRRSSSIRGQVRTGIRTHVRHFGRAPSAFWLPECAYRPAHIDGDGAYQPGLESYLAEEGVRCFFAETHAVEGGRPVGKAAGDAIGPYEMVPRRLLVLAERYQEPTLRTTYLPYQVGGSPVSAFARNNRTGLQVWSGTHGYPGDYRYREFHKRDDTSGLHYWKITGRDVDLGAKELWDPEAAFTLVREHARHFADLVRDLLADFRAKHGRHGVVMSAYDTELFGHWWFEGIAWLEESLRLLAGEPSVELAGASGFLEAHPPEEALQLPESSWGTGGNHSTWWNPDTEWMWPHLYAIEARLEELAASTSGGRVVQPTLQQATRQAVREALLAQSSDWPFLVTTGQAAEYASMRFLTHVRRFHELADAIEAGHIDQARLAELEHADNPFPDLQPEDWQARTER